MKMLKILAAASAIALLAGCAGVAQQPVDPGHYTYDGIPDQMVDAWVGACLLYTSPSPRDRG